MEYFFIQLKHNINIVLKSISSKYHIDYKTIKKKFLPKRLTKKLKQQILDLENTVNYSKKNEFIDTNYFIDKDANIYVIINDTRYISYNSVYDSIKI